MKSYSKNLRAVLDEIPPDDSGPSLAEAAEISCLSPGQVIMLGRNENPYGPSPRAVEAMGRASLERYPSTESFIEAASRYVGCPKDQIVVGAGLDGLMDSFTRLFLDAGDRALLYVPTYPYYDFLIRLCGAQPLQRERSEGYLLPETKVKLVFLCSPNNPSGEVMAEEELRTLVEETEAVVFLDEAYVEFAEKSLVRLVGEYENLVVGRTLSKAFGLAGLRLGYVVAPEWIAEQYRRISPDFGISAPSLAAGVAALEDLDHMRSSVSRITTERERMLSEMVEAEPSHANFLYVETAERSALVTQSLLKKGIVVKDCSSIPGAGDHYIRVTVGSPEQNDAFLSAYLAGC